MKTAVLWGLLALLCQLTLVTGHVLGRPYSTSDLAQLKSLLERFEDTLAEAAQEDNAEAEDYDGTNQEAERAQANRVWTPNRDEGQRPSVSERSQAIAEGNSRTASQRSRLQDLLMATRSRASGCFGSRMDRIGNSSGLGCNNGRG